MRMFQVKQAISLVITAVIMLSSAVTQASVCVEASESQSASVQDTQTQHTAKLDQIKHSESSEHSKPAHANHCHCVNQICCGFLITHLSTSTTTLALEKSTPLVSVSFSSWVGIPPTRPPSA